jgi:hypothetical protein
MINWTDIEVPFPQGSPLLLTAIKGSATQRPKAPAEATKKDL